MVRVVLPQSCQGRKGQGVNFLHARDPLRFDPCWFLRSRGSQRHGERLLLKVNTRGAASDQRQHENNLFS